MALLHPSSSECTNSGLDLFCVPGTQTAVEDGQFVEYHPIATLSHNAPIEFFISGATTDYIDLYHTYLHITARVVREDGTPLGVTDNVAPVNYYMHSLISQVDMFLNGTQVTGSDNTYPYRAIMEATLNMGREAKMSHLTSALYYKDTSGHLGESDGDNNEGLKTRRRIAAASREIDMMGRLHLDMFHQERFMLNGVDIKLRLIPTKSQFNLMNSNMQNEYKSVIRHASLFVRKLKLNPAVSLAHAKALERATAKFPIKRVLLRHHAIPAGQLTTILDNLFVPRCPHKIIIAFVKSSSFNGVYDENPFNFEHFNASHIALHVDRRQVPARALTPDFQRQKYVRSYHSMMLASGQVNRDNGNNINYKEFGAGYTFFAFDLSPCLLDGDSSFEMLKSGSLRVELRFSTALNQPITVIMYGETDSMLEIDRTRTCLTDFSQ